MSGSLLAHMKLTKSEKAMRTKKKNIIKKELENQLISKKMQGPIWDDRIQAYLKYWEIEQDLLRDIEIRGPNVEYNNGGGQNGVKKNDSLVQLPKISKEIRDLLSFLDVKVIEPPEGGEGDDSNV